VEARLVRCVGPIMTEGKVRLTRHKDLDMAQVEARLVLQVVSRI
jgi:hypothetical protein